MINLGIAYIMHLFKSIHLHGIHSPFIFDFQHKCLMDSSNYEDYKKIKSFRQKALRDHSSIEFEDYGAGSRVFKSTKREIAEIAKSAGSTEKHCRLIYRISRYYKVNSILELGTSLGFASHAVALGRPDAHITTVEADVLTYRYAVESFKEAEVMNITAINSTFNAFITKIPDGTTYDLIFIDGHHEAQATLNYFNQLLPYCHANSLIVFDDIYWSTEMMKAWKRIQTHEKVTASVDTFKWGMIFFREQQMQEQFHIYL